MKHFFEVRDHNGRVTSVYWAKAEDVTPKAWWEDHITTRCVIKGGACAADHHDNDKKADRK